MATYKVKKGDTLWDLSRKYGTTVDELARLNNIKNPNLIITGQTLKIPGYGTNAPQPKTPAPAKKAKHEPEYTQSDTVKKVARQLADWEASAPYDYQSDYSAQIDELYNRYVNRPKFSFDFNADPLYQQYKDQYIKSGNLAMRDTQGQAAALTGGYGSSYATTAAQQAYQAHLSQLNNVIPKLYDAAYGRYRDEGTDMQYQLGLLMDQDKIAYGRHRDGMNDYFDFLDYYSRKYDSERRFDYDKFIDEWNRWNTNRKFE